jgi:hypothetical protein
MLLEESSSALRIRGLASPKEGVMKKAILGLVWVVLVPGLVTAQAGEDSWDNLKQLQVGQSIEVVDTHMRSLKGDFIAFTDEVITLRQGKQERAVARPEVARVSLTVRRASHRKRNMILGAAIGGGAGLTIGVLADAVASGESTGCTGCIVGFTAAGAGGGLGLGALSGAQYKVIYRAKK